jgi:hypothetical protein
MTIDLANDNHPGNCISERQTPFGLWWRYTHNSNEPSITLVAAVRVAASVATDEARKRGKTSKNWRLPKTSQF